MEEIVMTEASKIRKEVEPYVQGFGIDIGCSDDKIGDNAIGFDCRNLPAVTICKEFNDLKLFGASQFDFVFSSHFLEHIKNPQVMLKEMKRVLKKSGYLVLYLPDPDLYTEDNPEHIELWTPQEFKKIIGKLGMQQKVFVTEHDYSYLYVGKKC